MEKSPKSDTDSTDNISLNKLRQRGRKRRRIDSNSSSESDNGLPENALEVEKSVVASAVKNNLDEVSVKKILKKVVTNDHVLALVKLREEEENANLEETGLRPKLTRSKVKELMKVSPKTAGWNLELTPIKHIPVKTRPEVKALIAQELQEDEEDEEYQPTNDDVPSDDDHCMESCSDVDSQPRTPATPRETRSSPKAIKDGPFKVPTDISTPVRRKLEMEEEATIALRTRSKLCLSETPIEHIESCFVPPDDPPMPPVDDHLWSDFLSECLNPASVSRHEDDDETDPEYSVAADPDAHEEDEEILESTLIKISKKELNDLVTELFNIMPEDSVDVALSNMANSVLTDDSRNESIPRWEGKQEPLSDDETPSKLSDKLVFERCNTFSVGKSEAIDHSYGDSNGPEKANEGVTSKDQPVNNQSKVVLVSVQDCVMGAYVPPTQERHPIRLQESPPPTIEVSVQGDVMLPEQVQILQQQLRQHVQFAASNFLQLYVHPLHWAKAPPYKEYLETLLKMADENSPSVVNVCNLRPAVNLIQSWEKAVSNDTPENSSMVEFIQKEAERWRRRSANNSFYVGEFHETLKHVVANSPVFLYPHLLPPMPYRPDHGRRSSYLRSEDELLALGLDQFWQYVDENPDMYKQPTHQHRRWGLTATTQLVAKYMFPFLNQKLIMQHLQTVRKHGDKDNPIRKFFESREITPVQHTLLPYNPKLTLYEQPEHEVPRLWQRYLAKSSKRFRSHLQGRTHSVNQSLRGVPIKLGLPAEPPVKPPLPISFTKMMTCNKFNARPKNKTVIPDKYDLDIQKPDPAPLTYYRLVETSNGATLVPISLDNNKNSDTENTAENSNSTIIPVVLQDATKMITNWMNTNANYIPATTVKESKDPTICINGLDRHPVIETNTVNCNVQSITNSKEVISNTVPEKAKELKSVKAGDHCKCCILLRKILKIKQTVITDYFKGTSSKKKTCYCTKRNYSNVTNKLKMLVRMYKPRSEYLYYDITGRKERLEQNIKEPSEILDVPPSITTNEADDLAFATEFQQKLTIRIMLSRDISLKSHINKYFSKFMLDNDPVQLAKRLEDVFGTALIEMNSYFVGFLTPEQADKMLKYKEYFLQICFEVLVKKVEETVKEDDVKLSILTALKCFLGGRWPSCVMCCVLLSRMTGYPELARYTFGLFPHPKEKIFTELKPKAQPSPPIISVETSQKDPLSQTEAVPVDNCSTEMTTERPMDQTLTNGDETIVSMDYEADHSSSSADNNNGADQICKKDVDDPLKIKTETLSPNVLNRCDSTVSEIEIYEYSDTSDSEMSMMIMSDEESIKTEPCEWKREEDKLILELLKEHLTPEKRKDKTISDIIEDKKIVLNLAESLPGKPTYEIKERILYIMRMLVLGEL